MPFLLALLLPTLMGIEGCSGPCTMILHNDTRAPTVVTYRYTAPGAKKARQNTLPVRPSETVEETMWWGPAPSELYVEATVGIRRLSWTIPRRQFPSPLLSGTTKPVRFHVHIKPQKITIEGPNPWDRYASQLILSFVAVSVGAIAYLVLRPASRKASRRRT